MKKVLVADDSPVSRELIREVLDNEGCQVIEAGDGAAALREIRGERPDLVLLDIQMPVLDGFAVLREIRTEERFAGLPVVAFTAYAMQGDAERALAAGFTSYLTKPIDIPRLRREIRRLLSREH